MPSGSSDSAENQNTVVSPLSVRPIVRSRIETIAPISAAPSPVATPSGGIWPDPGWVTISTPANPVSTASQRRHPVGSCRISAPRMVAKIGMEKPIVVASASGSSMTVAKFSVIDIRPSAQRSTCAPIRRVRSDAKPGPVATIAATSSVAPVCRQNMISISPAPCASASLIAAFITPNSAADMRRSETARSTCDPLCPVAPVTSPPVQQGAGVDKSAGDEPPIAR